MHDCHSKNLRQGITLVEVVVSTLLVGTIVVGSLSMLSAAVKSQTAASDLAKAPALANELMAEIMSHPYEDPEVGSSPVGTDSGESSSDRTTFDDIDDFHEWTRSPPVDRNNAALDGYTGWTRRADVYWAEQLNANGWMLDAGVKRVDVTVTSPTGVQTRFIAFRSEDGALEQRPTVDKNVITQISTSLSLGSMSTAVQGAVGLLNHVEDPNAN